MFMSDFRESVKISKEQLNTNNVIIKNLNEQEEVYNPNTRDVRKNKCIAFR